MKKYKKIYRILKGQQTSDGAGVKLNRIFGFSEEGVFDPFILLDFFGSDNPDDFIAGFPWHPHRGIETVTYLMDGKVEHQDSMGNKGILTKGDIQWMTAGSGIIHQEMPKPDGNRMFGFQLWVNLPASHKMINPRYQDIKSENIPQLTLENNIKVKVIAGEYQGVTGPVKDIIAMPFYLDVNIPRNTNFEIDINQAHTLFVLVYKGEGCFENNKTAKLKSIECGLFSREGSKMKVNTDESDVKFILLSAKPINEPIAWRGPIVMNTYEELNLAFKEFREGNFIK